MIFTNRTYDILKWVVVIVLPATSTLYFTLSMIWNLPYAEQIVGTIAAVTTFIGILIGVSTYHYNKGDSPVQ